MYDFKLDKDEFLIIIVTTLTMTDFILAPPKAIGANTYNLTAISILEILILDISLKLPIE